MDFIEYPVLNEIYLEELDVNDLTVIKKTFLKISQDFESILIEFEKNATNYVFLSKTLHKFKSSFYLAGSKKFGGLLEYLQTNPDKYTLFKEDIKSYFKEFQVSILKYFNSRKVK